MRTQLILLLISILLIIGLASIVYPTSTKFNGKTVQSGTMEVQAMKVVIDALFLARVSGYLEGYAEAKSGGESRFIIEGTTIIDTKRGK